MKTEDLAHALVADHATSHWSLREQLLVYCGGSLLAAIVIFWIVLGPRLGAMSSLVSWRFDLKFTYAAFLAVPAAIFCLKTSRPEHQTARQDFLLFLLAPATLAFGVGAELASLPPKLVLTHLLGNNSLKCLISIPALALAPLAILLTALGQAAPSSPACAGSAAGLVAASISAFLYASNCTDDSPLFVAVWYSIAIAIVMVIGRFTGQHVLRW